MEAGDGNIQPKGVLRIVQDEVELTQKELAEFVEEVHTECIPTDLSGDSVKQQVLAAIEYFKNFM